MICRARFGLNNFTFFLYYFQRTLACRRSVCTLERWRNTSSTRLLVPSDPPSPAHLATVSTHTHTHTHTVSFTNHTQHTSYYYSNTCFGSVHLTDHLRRIRAKETARSLLELTGDGRIFRHLHRYFVFLLKAGGLRITECVLEGPPRVRHSVLNYYNC